MKSTLIRILFGLLLALGVLRGTVAADRNVDIGIFVYQDGAAAFTDWTPMLAHLNQSLPGYHFGVTFYNAAELRQALAARQVDLVITNPGFYIEMEVEHGLSRIATMAPSYAKLAGRALGAVVFVRANRTDLNTLADLKGRKIASVARDAFGNFLVGALELQRAGIDPFADVTNSFVGLPVSGVMDAVRSGAADAGILRACIPEQLARQGLIHIGDFKYLAEHRDIGFDCLLSTPLYPNWPIATTRTTDPALAKAVARALLAMPKVPGEHSWTVPADYQPVHELYRELRLGPYVHLRDYSFEGLGRRYWPWIVGVLLLWLGGIVHMYRVELLVARRTQELRASLAARDSAERRSRESQAQMEHLSRLSVLGELSSNLAHEINQPLTTIGTYARSVLRRQSSGSLTDAAVTEACDAIAGEADRAAGVVRRMRDFGRKQSVQRSTTHIALLADEARRLTTGMLAHAPRIDIQNNASCAVLADGPQVLQVLLNLIKNAIDATRDLPVTRQAIMIRIDQADRRVVTRVIDAGPGLNAEQMQRMFEPFFTTKSDGLGLGLSICKSIIEAHGGRLWVEANDGAGLCLSFSLPCHEPNA